IYHSNPGFLVYAAYDTEKDKSGKEYVILRYPKYNGKEQESFLSQSDTGKKATNRPHRETVHVEILDGNAAYNGMYLAILKTDFDQLEKILVYDNSWNKARNYQFSSGLLTVPFKFRPAVNDSTNFNLTTDITLGPYFGFTKRLSKRGNNFITIPF